jgi:hypothetical protein
MRFTVVWKPTAVESLAALWLESSCRHQLSAAADEIDAMLRTQPNDTGELLTMNTRIVVHLPIAVVYDVRPDDRLVEVLKVAAFPTE